MRLGLALLLVLMTGAVFASQVSAEPGLRKSLSMGSINHGGDYEDLTVHGNLDIGAADRRPLGADLGALGQGPAVPARRSCPGRG